jgi:hypothetical protein
MPDGMRWVGLDVHAHESTIAIFEAQRPRHQHTANPAPRPGHHLLLLRQREGRRSPEPLALCRHLPRDQPDLRGITSHFPRINEVGSGGEA